MEVWLADPEQTLRTALDDRYDVIRHIGSGGMAEVYLARDRKRACDVALKVIRDELTAAVGADRFLREIAITGRLFHPNIRPLLDSGETDGILYYVMPYVKDETLRDRLKRERQLGLEAALTFARDIADSLSYAHSEGVVHRDVKPSNIFIENRRALLSDFGIAIAMETADAERLTASGIAIGTAEYMAPEQCEDGVPIDGRADIYSLGCVLYEMLTGQPPFTGRTRLAVIAKQIRELAPSAATLRPDLPGEVVDLLHRCLAKTPADRFATAGELRDSIEHALTQWQTGGGRATPRPGPKPWQKPLIAAAAVAAAAITWAVLPDPAALDVHKVVVYPLADRGGGAADRGSAVAMMLGNALLHAEPLRPIDGWSYLSASQRANAATASLRDLRSIAASRGAAYFITGGVTLHGDSTSVLLELHDTRGDSVVQQASFTGAAARLTADQVGIRAMIELLPALIDPGRKIDMSILTDRDAAAVSFWIRGDLEYRQARFTNALALYREAVQRDSLLVLAALKGAQAASWAEQSQRAAELLRLAEANASKLPLRYQHFATGLRAYFDGRADAAVSAYRDALGLEPEWSEAWMALGEVYQHLLPSDMRTDTSARSAFERAAATDPDFHPALVHLTEYAVRAGDLRHARSLLGQLSRSGAEGAARVAAVTLVVDCAEQGPDSARWRSAAEQDDDVVLEAAQMLAVGAAYLSCAETGFRSLLDVAELPANMRWAATMGLQSVMVAEARSAEAQALLDETAAAGISAAFFLPPLDVLAGADLQAGAARVDSIAEARSGAAFEGASPRTLWLIASWRAWLGNRQSVELLRSRLVDAMRRLPLPANLLMFGAADARYRLLTADTAGAIETLQRLRAVGTRAELLIALYEAFPAERLLLAELLLARNRPEEAYWAAAALDHPQPLLFTAFVPRSLALRYHAASALTGAAWRSRAAEARRRLAAIGRSDLLATAN
jgi:hypothetical protein